MIRRTICICTSIEKRRGFPRRSFEKLLRTAATAAAASKANFEESRKIAIATPAQAFNIAKKMYQNEQPRS